MAKFFEQYRAATGATTPINAGLDFVGAGGLYIGKRDSSGIFWSVYDTERGKTAKLSTDNTNAEVTNNIAIDSFDSTGVTIGADNSLNFLGDNTLDLLFLQEAGFLDIVTYTGNGTSQTIPHNLGTEVGHLIVKNRSLSTAWANWHKGFTGTQYLNLENNSAIKSADIVWNSTAPDASNFYVGKTAGAGSNAVNASGDNYVAYLFAHNPDKGIFCGSYTGTGAGNKQTIGFKPKFLLFKCIDAVSDWHLLSESLNPSATTWSQKLSLNTPDDTFLLSSNGRINIYNDGFDFTGSSTFNPSGLGFIFIAIGDVLPTGIPIEFRGSDALLYQYLLTQGYTGQINEVIAKWLLAEGYDGQINEAKYKYLEALGYTDFTLPAREYRWRNNL